MASECDCQQPRDKIPRILKVRWNFEKIKQISIHTGLTIEKELTEYIMILSMMMWKLILFVSYL